jgi:hypothetical protein
VLFGSVQYDIAEDNSYFTYGLQLRYYLKPALRLGFMGGTAHIGDPPLCEWTAEGTDERMWRGAGFLEVARSPFHKTSIALRGFIGVYHSSGVIVEPSPPNSGSFYGITDANTGLSYGGGFGLEVGPYYRMRVFAQLNLWQDNAYGATASDPEIIFGVGVDWYAMIVKSQRPSRTVWPGRATPCSGGRDDVVNGRQARGSGASRLGPWSAWPRRSIVLVDVNI